MTDRLSESGYSFAVPALIMRWLGIEPPLAVATRRATVISSGFDIVADLFTFDGEMARNEAVATLQRRGREQGRELVLESCEIDVASFALLVTKEPTAEFLNVDETPTPNGVIDAKEFVESDMLQVEALSRFTGLRIIYCYGTSLSNPPLPEKSGTVHLFYRGRPPGVCNIGLVAEKLFGMDVWEDGKARIVNVPTRGRGRLIYEGETPIFQVLGSTYYQICLTHTTFHSSAREEIFRKLLGCMYRDLVECRNQKTEPVAEATAEDFASFGAIRATATIGELRNALEKLDCIIQDEEGKLADNLHALQTLAAVLKEMQELASSQVQDAKDTLAEKLGERQLLTVVLKATQDSEFIRGLRERLPRELGEIKNMEGVEAVRIVDDGVHIATTDIVLEHNGRRYNLGPFTIRLDPNGKSEAWSEVPRHTRGHHHPHIDRINLTCYGSATVAIAKYMSEFRFADATLIIMRWLHTYAPETTLHQLEEWPVEPDERR